MAHEPFEQLERQVVAPEALRVERTEYGAIFRRELVVDGLELVELHARPAGPTRAAYELLERWFGRDAVRHVHVPGDTPRDDLVATLDGLGETLERAEGSAPFWLRLQELTDQELYRLARP